MALMEGIMRFGKKGKLSPHYVGPFEIMNHIGQVVYKLILPAEMSTIYDVFDSSMLKTYTTDLEHVIAPQTVQIQADLRYEEKPVQILDREVKKLRNKKISLVKVLWRNYMIKEAT